LTFYFYGKWQSLHQISFLASILSFLYVMVFLHESIRFSFMKNDKHQVIKTLHSIAKFNNREKEFYKWIEDNFKMEKEENVILNQEIEVQQQNNRMSTFSLIISSREQLFNFIVFSYVSFVIMVCIIYNTIDVKHTDDIFLNPIIFYLTDFIIILATGFVIDNNYIGRKKACDILYCFSYNFLFC